MSYQTSAAEIKSLHGTVSARTHVTIQDSIHPRRDFRDVFTQSEVASALRLFGPKHEAEKQAALFYAEMSEPWVLTGDVLSALSLLSPDAADRVRRMLGETKEQERERLETFRHFLKQRRTNSDDSPSTK